MTPKQTSALRCLAGEKYEGLRNKFKSKSNNAGFEAFVAVLEDAHRLGLNVALSSEESAWEEVNRLEDLIIGLLRYAPDADLVQARASAKAASLTDQPELYAKAVSIAMGSPS